MPCGGIYTVMPLEERKEWYDDCAWCHKFWDENGRAPNHYVEEWDGLMLHSQCVLPWLHRTAEGRCVNKHKHLIEVDHQVMYEEGEERSL